MAALAEFFVTWSQMHPNYYNYKRNSGIRADFWRRNIIFQVNSREESLGIPFQGQKISEAKANRYENTQCVQDQAYLMKEQVKGEANMQVGVVILLEY